MPNSTKSVTFENKDFFKTDRIRQSVQYDELEDLFIEIGSPKNDSKDQISILEYPKRELK